MFARCTHSKSKTYHQTTEFSQIGYLKKANLSFNNPLCLETITRTSVIVYLTDKNSKKMDLELSFSAM